MSTPICKVWDAEKGKYVGIPAIKGADGISLYTTTQDSALETTPFDIIYITTNDQTLVVGDLILTPTGRLYRVTSVSTSFVDAAYTTSLRGPQGVKGDTGSPGKDGHSPVVTATTSGKTTTISVDGTAIATVEDGTDGHTPVRGTDYWTASDKQEIVTDVLAALPDGTEVSY